MRVTILSKEAYARSQRPRPTRYTTGRKAQRKAVGKYKESLSAYEARLKKYKLSKEAYEKKISSWKKKYEPYLTKRRGVSVFQAKRQLAERTVKKAFKEYKKTGVEIEKGFEELKGEAKEVGVAGSALEAERKAIPPIKHYETISMTDYTSPGGYKYFGGKGGKLAGVEDPVLGESRLATKEDIIEFGKLKESIKTYESMPKEIRDTPFGMATLTSTPREIGGMMIKQAEFQKDIESKIPGEIQRYEAFGYSTKEARVLGRESIYQGGVTFVPKVSEKILIEHGLKIQPMNLAKGYGLMGFSVAQIKAGGDVIARTSGKAIDTYLDVLGKPIGVAPIDRLTGKVVGGVSKEAQFSIGLKQDVFGIPSIIQLEPKKVYEAGLKMGKEKTRVAYPKIGLFHVGVTYKDEYPTKSFTPLYTAPTTFGKSFETVASAGIQIGLVMHPATAPIVVPLHIGAIGEKAAREIIPPVQKEGFKTLPKHAISFAIKHPLEVGFATFVGVRAVSKSVKIIKHPAVLHKHPAVLHTPTKYKSLFKKAKYLKMDGEKIPFKVKFGITPEGYRGTRQVLVTQAKTLQIGKHLKIPLKTKSVFLEPVGRGQITLQKDSGKILFGKPPKIEGRVKVKWLKRFAPRKYKEVTITSFGRKVSKYKVFGKKSVYEKQRLDVGQTKIKEFKGVVESKPGISVWKKGRGIVKKSEKYIVKSKQHGLRKDYPTTKGIESRTELTKVKEPSHAMRRESRLKILKGESFRETTTFRFKTQTAKTKLFRTISKKQMTMISKKYPQLSRRARFRMAKKVLTYKKPRISLPKRGEIEVQLDKFYEPGIKKPIKVFTPKAKGKIDFTKAKDKVIGKPKPIKDTDTMVVSGGKIREMFPSYPKTKQVVVIQEPRIVSKQAWDKLVSRVEHSTAERGIQMNLAMERMVKQIPHGTIGFKTPPLAMGSPLILQPRIKGRVETRMQPRIKTRIETRMQPRIKTRIETRMKTRLKSRLETRLKTRLKTRLTTTPHTTIIRTPPTTPPPIPPPFILPSLRKKKKVGKKITKGKTELPSKYTPSLIAIGRQIYTTKPVSPETTGLPIRPIKRRKKRKR